MERGILVQRAMNARFIIISGKLVQDPAQVRLPEHDHVVETFPSDRAYQSLDVRVLPGRARGDGLVADAVLSENSIRLGIRVVRRQFRRWIAVESSGP